MTTATATARQPVLGLPDPGERVPGLAWPTVALYVAVVAAFGVEAYGLAMRWHPWIIAPLGMVVTFGAFTVLHEATHHAISTHTRVNNSFGHLSVPLVAPYALFPMIKFIHIEHHRNTNEEKGVDPDHWTSEGPAWQLPLRWATLDLWYVVFYLSRIRTRPRAEAASQLVVFFSVVTAFGWLALGGYAGIVLPYLVGQRLGVALLAWWFDYLPHHGLPFTQRENKYRATRVRVGGESWMTPLFVYQNYHLVHHLHPSIPFYRYIRAWRRNEQAYLDRDAAISTWFGRSLTASEYRTWRRITDSYDTAAGASRPEFHTLRVQSILRLTDDSVAITFDVPADLAEAYDHLPGQHVTVRAVIDGVDVRRSYSLTTPSSARTLRIAIKRIDDGVFSTYANTGLQPGDLIDVMTPTGRFQTPLDPTNDHRYVGVAAGSGITPLMSIIATTLEVEPLSSFDLIYGNKTRESTMFADELDQLQKQFADRLRIHHVLSRTPGAGLSGRISTGLTRHLISGHVDAWFLCGPQELIETLQADLGTTERTFSEVFFTEHSTDAVQIDIEAELTIALNGTESTFALRSTGDTILDAALQQGLEPPYSCAGGACGTCRAKVTLGRAVMDQNHALGDEEVAAGYVLTCQAHPITESVAVDYDR